MERKKLRELATCRVIAHGDNVVFLGPPGTGKPPLAIAWGLQAVQQGYRTWCTAALPRLATLTKAYAEHRLEERLTPYWVPKLRLLDAMGSIPTARQGAHLSFQLISRR